MRRLTLILGLAIVCLVILAGYAMLPASFNDERVTAVIPQGANAKQVAGLLKDAGAIRSTGAFVLLARLSGQAGDLKPGQYELRRNALPFQIVRKIARGEVAAGWVTIPEGYTIRQIADLLAEKGIADREAFIGTVLYGRDRMSDVVQTRANMEGYLFPDTYLIPRGAGATAAAKLMYDNFDRKVWRTLNTEIRASKLYELSGGSKQSVTLGDCLHAVITLASLIEREAKTDEDRALISGVLWNRLRRGMKLDVDATIQYALGNHKSRLFFRDLAVDSAYNTYKNPGLPPGPIANPGLRSIQAALRPAKCPYLYYVARPDGSHVFTRTLEEHNRAVAAIRAESRMAAPSKRSGVGNGESA